MGLENQLENQLPQEDGMYRFVLFLQGLDSYSVVARPYNQSFHLGIGREVTEKFPKQLGIMGGGILTYSNGKITFHVGSSYGPSPANPRDISYSDDVKKINKFRENLESAMKRVPEVKYDAPLDEANEPVRRRSLDYGGLSSFNHFL